MAYAALWDEKRCPTRSLTRRSFSMISLRLGCGFPVRIFVGEVLQRFNLQIHHLTPNAFARVGVFTMVLKMSRCALSVNTFARYYETHMH
jgi:hypothetical protein